MSLEAEYHSRTPYDDLNLNLIMSTLETGLILAGSICIIVAYLIAYYKATTFLGRPWGVMIVRIMPAPPEWEKQTIEEQAVSKVKLEKLLGSIVGGMMFVVALGIESVSIDMRRSGDSEFVFMWTIWNFLILFVKAGVEGLIAVGLTGGAIRLAKLG